MRHYNWSRLILGLCLIALAACQPISDNKDETAVTPDITVTDVSNPVIAQRPTEPSTIPAKATTQPPSKPTSQPTAIPTVTAPDSWQWVGNEMMGLQLAIPPDWLNLSTQLDTADTVESLGLTALFLVDNVITGESLVADKPINQGAFLSVSLTTTPLDGATVTQKLQTLLTQLQPRITPIGDGIVTPATAAAPSGLVQGAMIEVSGHPLSLFATSSPNLITRIILFPRPDASDSYAIFALSASATQWSTYQPLFEQIMATAVLHTTQPDFTVAGGQAHLVGTLTAETAVNVSLSQNVRDIWEFTASEARYATINLTPDDTNLDLKLTIVDPDGNVVAAIDNGYGGDAEIATDILLQRAGKYIVEVKEFQGKAGWYTLQLQLTDTPQFNGRGQIQLGQTVQNNLLETGQHIWEFTGIAGQEISVVLSPQDDQFDAILDLYSPDGERLLALDEGFSGDAEIISGFTLPFTGLYTLLVRNFANEGGSYTISLNEGKEETENFYEAGDILYEQARQESLREREVHAWYFSGKAGDKVSIEVTPLVNELDLEVWLFDPNLNRIITQDQTLQGAPESLALTLPMEGEYVLLVRDFSGEVGDYQVALTAMPIPEPTYAGILGYGRPATQTLAIEEQVYWVFTAQEGEVVDITLTPLDNNSDLILILQDSDTRTLQTVDNNAARGAESIQNFVVPADGDWYVVVKSFLDSGGNYTLLVERSGQ